MNGLEAGIRDAEELSLPGEQLAQDYTRLQDEAMSFMQDFLQFVPLGDRIPNGVRNWLWNN